MKRGIRHSILSRIYLRDRIARHRTRAGTSRALLVESKATHVVRVTGWPVGAVAIDGTVYLNAAWLVARARDATRDPGSTGTHSF